MFYCYPSFDRLCEIFHDEDRLYFLVYVKHSLAGGLAVFIKFVNFFITDVSVGE